MSIHCLQPVLKETESQITSTSGKLRTENAILAVGLLQVPELPHKQEVRFFTEFPPATISIDWGTAYLWETANVLTGNGHPSTCYTPLNS